jgi:hypothetical protein
LKKDVGDLMKFLTHLPLIFACLSTACSEPPHKFPCHSNIDSSFTDDERSDVQVAMSAWTLATDGIVTFDIAQDGLTRALDHQIVRASHNDKVIVNAAIQDDRSNHDQLGYAIVGGDDKKPFIAETGPVWIVHDNIQLVTDMYGIPYRQVFRRTTMHELGHHIGLHHDDEPSSLMWPNTTLQSVSCITAFDTQRFCEEHYPACEGHDMRQVCIETDPVTGNVRPVTID